MRWKWFLLLILLKNWDEIKKLDYRVYHGDKVHYNLNEDVDLAAGERGSLLEAKSAAVVKKCGRRRTRCGADLGMA